ncbi:MAG: hypothetical protein GY716_12385 [bacterium]|nr:hypothetical protein [bacterium]
MVVRTLVVLLLVWTASAPARAWSGDVHVLVCEGAWQLLSPAAKKFYVAVRHEARQAGLPSAGLFAQSCRWPDTVRRSTHRSTYEYHFINVQAGAKSVDADRDCAAHDCAPRAIERYTAYLLAPAVGDRSKKRREEALRFVGHFVADLHQPLHAGYAEDRGGNTIEVSWVGGESRRGKGNLHAYWDALVPEAAGFTGALDIGGMLRRIPAAKRDEWRSLDVWSWTDESFRLARAVAYTDGSERRLRSGAHLDGEHLARAVPVAREQILKAAVRLAQLLEAVAAGTDPFAPTDCR